MLEMTKDGAVRELCSNDVASCGLARLSCCVNCGRAATRSALTAAVLSILVIGEDWNDEARTRTKSRRGCDGRQLIELLTLCLS